MAPLVVLQIQPFSSQVLALRKDPGPLAVCLSQLQGIFKDCNPAGLSACLDYASFPLLFGLDSIVSIRSPKGECEV